MVGASFGHNFGSRNEEELRIPCCYELVLYQWNWRNIFPSEMWLLRGQCIALGWWFCGEKSTHLTRHTVYSCRNPWTTFTLAKVWNAHCSTSRQGSPGWLVVTMPKIPCKLLWEVVRLHMVQCQYVLPVLIQILSLQSRHFAARNQLQDKLAKLGDVIAISKSETMNHCWPTDWLTDWPTDRCRC